MGMREKETNISSSVGKLGVAVVICLCEFLVLEYSALDFSEWSFAKSKMFFLINLAMVTLPNVLLFLIARRWTLPLLITSVISTVWGIVNHYTILLHGLPLSVTALSNVRTALNVISNYHLAIDGKILCLCGAFAVEATLLVFLRRCEKKAEKESWKTVLWGVAILALNLAFLYVCLFSPHAIKPDKTIGWSWKDSAKRYGYLCYLLEDAGNALHPVTKPDGYDVNLLKDLETGKTADSGLHPDIILILNESFFDLSVYTDIQTDADYLDAFYGIKGAVFGYAVSPMIGGGTNNSEYELLTSNSMYLLNADAPFNYLDMGKDGSNLVAWLNGLGYETCGMHCAKPANYCRDRAYPALGLDHVRLGADEFETFSSYGKRPWTDSDNYLDMMKLYEELGDGPRFVFQLTYQNHGGYEQNTPDYDTVHVLGDYGELTDDLNEYLTGIQMSAEAIGALTDRLAKSDRPTIVCMVGDHAPSFIQELTPKAGMTSDEMEIVARSVPYMIWANFVPETSCYTDYVSMVDIGPMVLKMAGLPLSTYYQTILQLHEDVPVRTSYGTYMDKQGKIEGLSDSSSAYSAIMQYYYLEYNGLHGGNDFQKSLFTNDR